MTHTRMQLMISFVAGAMLGVGLLHLLPHAIFELRHVHDDGHISADPVDFAVGCMLAGFILMFFIERCFHFHHHEAPAPDSGSAENIAAEEHQHTGSHEHTHTGDTGAKHRFAWLGAMVGLMLHTTIDGMALSASVAAETHDGHAHPFPGVGTFLVIFLHKPFDSMTIGALMAAGGWSRGWRFGINLLYASAIPLGVGLYHLTASQLIGAEHAGVFLGGALAFASGTFLCIATSDLLPELQFHSHDRLKLSLALILGLAIAIGVGFLESNHHRVHPAQSQSDATHDHGD